MSSYLPYPDPDLVKHIIQVVVAGPNHTKPGRGGGVLGQIGGGEREKEDMKRYVIDQRL